jgi:hypothetical protein
MLCVAYSVREQTGIARWLAELSGVTAQWAGEDARAPGAVDPAQSTRAAYWGLVHGQKLGATNEKYEIPLVLTREVVFTIDPGIAHTYTFTVGTTPVPVAVTALHVQADVPALMVAAWALSGLGLNDDGTAGGVVLTVVNATTYRFTAAASIGGVPVIEWGYGFVPATEVPTANLYLVEVETIQHTMIATYWGMQRGRGAAKRACCKVELATGTPEVFDRLLLYTGQVASLTVLTEVDRLGLGDGTPTSTADVAQLEITVSAITVRTTLIPTLAGFVVEVTAQTGTTGDIITITDIEVEVP